MPHAERVRRGDGVLPGVSLQDLQEMRDGERDPKARTILQAAIHRKTGLSLDRIAGAIGFVRSTVYGWLARLAAGGAQRRHDRKSPGRPCRLDERQRVQLDGIIRGSPERSGFHSDMWISCMVTGCIWKVFGVRYSPSGALKLADRNRLFCQKVQARAVEHRRPGGDRKVREGGCQEDRILPPEGAHALLLGRVHNRQLLRTQIRDTAEGGEGHDMHKPFEEGGSRPRGAGQRVGRARLSGEPEVGGGNRISEAPARKIRQDPRDTGQRGGPQEPGLRKYMESTDGGAASLFLPPRTPQHNPIEMLWREIKKAILNTYFDGEDEMKERIARLGGGRRNSQNPAPLVHARGRLFGRRGSNSRPSGSRSFPQPDSRGTSLQEGAPEMPSGPTEPG